MLVCLFDSGKKSPAFRWAFLNWFAFRHIHDAQSVTGSKELIANLLLNSNNPLPMDGCCALGGVFPILKMGIGWLEVISFRSNKPALPHAPD